MTKRRRSDAWKRTHSDLLATVNAERSASGLPVIVMPKAKRTSRFADRKPFRADTVPPGYVPIEGTRIHQTEKPQQPTTTAEDLTAPYWWSRYD